MAQIHSIHQPEKAKDKNIEALEKLRKSLELLEWDIGTQAVLSFCGIGQGEYSWKEETQMPSWSTASQMGFKNLASFVNQNQHALGMDWKDWTLQAKALFYKNKYGICSAKPADVVTQYEDVCAMLGFVPSTPEEYHQVKDKVIAEQKLQVEAEHNRITHHLNEKIKSLSIDVEEGRSESIRQKAQIADLDNQMENKSNQLKGLTALSAGQKEELEKSIEEISLVKENARIAFSSLEKELAETEELLLKATAELESANRKSAKLQALYDELSESSTTKIEVLQGTLNHSEQKLKESELGVEKLSGEVLRLTGDIEKLQGSLSSSQADQAKLASENAQLKQDAEKQLSSINMLEKSLNKASQLVKAKEQEIEKYKINIVRLEHEISTLKLERHDAPTKVRLLEKEIREQRERFRYTQAKNRTIATKQFKDIQAKLDAALNKIIEAKTIITAKNDIIRSSELREMKNRAFFSKLALAATGVSVLSIISVVAISF